MNRYRELSLDERKKIGIEILSDFDKVCKKNKITYFLAYGTLIGALRHKGFIPWDDDIDVWVPIEYYEKMLQVLELESKYKLLNHLTDEEWPLCFSKLCDSDTIIVDLEPCLEVKRGVAIDIFPLFHIHNKAQMRQIGVCAGMIWKSFEYSHGEKSRITSFKGMVKNTVFQCVEHLGGGTAYWRRRMLKCEKTSAPKDNVGCPISPYGMKDVHDFSCFSSVRHVEFEGHCYPAPIGAEKVLTKIYGDYMKLPPEDKRVTNHDVKAYILECSD